jgi:hypothetical protein
MRGEPDGGGQKQEAEKPTIHDAHSVRRWVIAPE